jgi:hypothetical protein
MTPFNGLYLPGKMDSADRGRLIIDLPSWRRALEPQVYASVTFVGVASTPGEFIGHYKLNNS